MINHRCENTVKIAILGMMVVVMGIRAHAQPQLSPLQKYVQNAVANMDIGKPDQAIRDWDSAIAMSPTTIEYQYERIICFVMKKEYDTAFKLLTPIYKDTNLLDRGYQLMGNILDLRDDSVSSMKYYQEGLKAYPRSGRLHYEIGAAALVERRFDDAVQWWVKGTKAEPGFATNYYWLAKVHSGTKNKLWTLIYGEVFLNLERGSKRTKEISKLLFDTWNAGLAFGDSVDPINLAADDLLEAAGPSGPSSMSFPMSFEYTLAITGQYLIPKEGVLRHLTIAQLVELRTKFIQAWAKKGYLETYPNDLLSWQQKVFESGHLREYLYWLLSFGDFKEMNQWYRANEDKYDLFLHWFDTNSLPVTNALRLGL